MCVTFYNGFSDTQSLPKIQPSSQQSNKKKERKKDRESNQYLIGTSIQKMQGISQLNNQKTNDPTEKQAKT